ncbi:hypothetical protein ACS0TY_026130 [Phlomoides rotata]
MDGYNQYPWNQGYYQSSVVYPPQYENVGYNNGMSYDYNYHSQYAYSHDWSNVSPSTNFEPQQEERKPTLEEMVAAYIARSDQRMEKVEEQLRSLSDLPNQMKNLEYQIGQIASSSYEEPGMEEEEDPSEEEEEEEEEGELNDEQREFIELFDEIIREFNEFELNDQVKEPNISRVHANSLFDEKTNRILPFIVLNDDRSPLKAKEEDKHCLIEDEGQDEKDPNNEKDEDDNLKDEKEEEKSPSIEEINMEKQNQEEANDELKSEMSISKPLNSSICTLFDKNASIDFILPLESLDYKKEVDKILGVLKQGGKQLKKILWKVIEKMTYKKGMGDRSTFHWRLIDEEAQRLRYNGKEDRYPWPFR